MSEQVPANNESPPPHVRLVEMGTAGFIAMIVHAAAKFDIADHLAGGARSAEALAQATGTHAPSLYRLLRTLAGMGILAEGPACTFSLTPMGEALKTGAPGAARETILTFAGPAVWDGIKEFPYSVQTGKTGLEKVFGMPTFDWYAKHPQEASWFSQAMIGMHGGEPPAVAAAYDFPRSGTLVDVGGATGHMLTTVLARHAGLRGVLFDVPHVEQQARDLIRSRGLSERITIETGNFFERVPKGGDLYLLSHIIHDWREDQCLTILSHVRKAMNPGGRLLLIEMVLPPGNVMHPGKILDMLMLVGTGGQERTEQEYGALLAKADFRLTRVVPTQSPVSVIEAV
jgi:O-methyltransferase domain